MHKTAFGSVWAYRGFVLASIRREFQLRYRNSLLGALWTVLQPLAMIVVYTVVFSRIMKARLPDTGGDFAYSIYLCAGILTWGLFAEITSRNLTVFLDNANTLKKLSFPRICLPLIVTGSALLNFGIIFSLFVLFLIFTGNFPGWSFLAFFPVLALQVAFSSALGLLLGLLNVFFRDVGQFFAVLMQFWFWLTPIVYLPDIVPESMRVFLQLNPMAHLIFAYQGIFLHNQPPDWLALAPVAILSLLVGALALTVFRKRSSEMVDEL